MKTVLMTGLTGTLGPKVARQFNHRGWNVVEWDHHQIAPDNKEQSESFLNKHSFDAVCHMAMGSEEWTARLAEYCAQKNIAYLFTSTAMVFDSSVDGPYSIFSERNAQEAYGQYKARCEDRIWEVNPNAMVARLGWQIHDEAVGNNMLAHLDNQAKEQGVINASTQWYPATSHMDDTSLACLQLIERNEPGLYHLDSNAQERWSFYNIACALRQHYKRSWSVVPSTDYKHDQRLHDERIALPPLSSRYRFDGI